MSTKFGMRLKALSAEERKEIKAQVREANAEVDQNWEDAAFHQKLRADLTETTEEGFEHEAIIDVLMETETVDEGERIKVSEVRGLQVYWVSIGGTIDQSRLTRESFELEHDQVGFHLSEVEEKMRANFVEESSDIIELAIKQMDAEINRHVLSLWEEAIPDNTSDFYIEEAGVSLASLDTAIREVADETEEENPVIVARRTMLDKVFDAIQDSALYLPETNERLIQLGSLGIYRGCRIMKLTNFKDQWNKPFFPKNQMYVAGRDAGKYGFWGGLRTWEWVVPGGGDWNFKGRKKSGGAIHHPERVRRIVDTSQAAA